MTTRARTFLDSCVDCRFGAALPWSNVALRHRFSARLSRRLTSSVREPITTFGSERLRLNERSLNGGRASKAGVTSQASYGLPSDRGSRLG